MGNPGLDAEIAELENQQTLTQEEKTQLENLRELNQLVCNPIPLRGGKRLVDLEWLVSTKMYAELMAKMLDRGYEFESARCLFENPPLKDRRFIETLLDVVNPEWDKRLVDDCLRVVERYKLVYDGRKLAEIFDHPITPWENRWIVGNVTTMTKPRGINEWMMETVQRNRKDESRDMLCWGIGRLCKKEDANRVLPKVLKDFPWHAARGLSYSGGEIELAILKKAQKWPEVQKDAESRNEFKRVIAKIEKRLAKQKT